MRARLVRRRKRTDARGDITEVVIWKVPPGLRYPDGVRCRLAFVPAGRGEPVIPYDNHYPKGRHKHEGGEERPYAFSSIAGLVDDFETDVAAWRARVA